MLSEYLGDLIEANGIEDCIYAEPYAGGAGAAINLLLSGRVDRIVLNDADRCVWSFWRAILTQTEEFIELVRQTPVTIKEWHRQREIYTTRPRNILKLGFAAFFLNRCNRSGILTRGGVIGGLEQTGKWKIDARYNKEQLIRRIERIAAYRDGIEAHNFDALDFIRTRVLSQSDRSKFFVYLDPPYYVQGSRLYLNYYNPLDHVGLSRFLQRTKNFHWLVTYDNTPETRALYSWCRVADFSLRYSAHSAREGKEIMVFGPTLRNVGEEPARKAS